MKKEELIEYNINKLAIDTISIKFGVINIILSCEEIHSCLKQLGFGKLYESNNFKRKNIPQKFFREKGLRSSIYNHPIFYTLQLLSYATKE